MGVTPLTTLNDVLDGAGRVGIDTTLFIYFIERSAEYSDLLRDFFRRIDSGKIDGVSSVLTLTEVLTKPVQDENLALETAYRDYLRNSRNFTLVPVNSDIAEKAARLRAIHALRTPDAIHIATAIETGCDLFVTNDHRLRHVSSLQITLLSELTL